MSDTGWVIAGTGADVAGDTGGAISWTSPGNVTADDSSNASATTGEAQASHYLVASNFGLSIPAGAVITGISVQVRETGIDAGHSMRVFLSKDAATTHCTSSLSILAAGLQSVGTATTRWFTSAEGYLTGADVASANFAVLLSTAANTTATVDAVWVKVFYGPVYVNVSTGATDAGGTWSVTGTSSLVEAGDVVILQILQDGATAGAVALTSASGIEDLAGTDNQWTSIGAFAVGSPTAAYQHLWIGRHLTTGAAPTASGTNSTSEDLYMRMYCFRACSVGTTLATVIENGTAGTATGGVGTSNTASDVAVTTLGPDRLALNFVAVDDDNPIAQFSGMTGGTWVEVAEYAEASGTDGSVQMQHATMATAGTIDGGTASITDPDNWGVVGFALIGTTSTGRQPRHGFVLFQDPGIM